MYSSMSIAICIKYPKPVDKYSIMTVMTTKQAKLTNILPEIVANGGTLSQAMRQAGYSESMARNPQKLKKMPVIKNELQRLLKKKGITLDKALQPIADGLQAEKLIAMGKGEDSFIDRIPNHQVRLAASDRALKLLNITKEPTHPTSLKELQTAIQSNVDEVEMTKLVFKKDG